MRRFPVFDRGNAPAKIADGRLSKLQKRMLCWLDAEARRTEIDVRPKPTPNEASPQTDEVYGRLPNILVDSA